MTEVKLFKKNGSLKRFLVSGHSGYSEHGSDIVCAAISSVVWTIVTGLEEVCEIKINILEKDGIIDCTLPTLSKEKRREADILLCSMVLFVKDLEGQYKNYITVTEVELC